MPENGLQALQDRNRRVEADKAWEKSWTRRLLIAGGTYTVVTLYLAFLGVQNAPWHAAVPATGYLLSTLTLPLAKNLWIKRIYIAKDS